MPDLGSDKVWRLGRTTTNSVGQWKINGYIQQPAGSGPRHIRTIGMFCPNFLFYIETLFSSTLKSNANGLTFRFFLRCIDSNLYTIHEIGNTITHQIIPSTPGNDFPALIANLTTLPIIPSGSSPSSFGAGELLLLPTISANQTQRYLLASNRNVGSILDPKGDTIAIFSTEPTLQLVKQVYTGLNQIRGMMTSNNGAYVIAAGKEGGGVAVFEVIGGGTDLVLRARYTGTASSEISSFVWI